MWIQTIRSISSIPPQPLIPLHLHALGDSCARDVWCTFYVFFFSFCTVSGGAAGLRGGLLIKCILVAYPQTFSLETMCVCEKLHTQYCRANWFDWGTRPLNRAHVRAKAEFVSQRHNWVYSRTYVVDRRGDEYNKIFHFITAAVCSSNDIFATVSQEGFTHYKENCISTLVLFTAQLHCSWNIEYKKTSMTA